MRIIKLAWVGTRTDNAQPTVAFFRDVLELASAHPEGSNLDKLRCGLHLKARPPLTIYVLNSRRLRLQLVR
jgi:hypothetical protein